MKNIIKILKPVTMSEKALDRSDEVIEDCDINDAVNTLDSKVTIYTLVFNYNKSK